MSTFYSYSGGSPPDPEKFGLWFESIRNDALRVIIAFGIAPDRAEDAVQDAATYLLENLARFTEITKSYAIQLAVSRAKNGERGHRRKWRWGRPVGNNGRDLDRVIEAAAGRQTGGRKKIPRNQPGLEGTQDPNGPDGLPGGRPLPW